MTVEKTAVVCEGHALIKLKQKLCTYAVQDCEMQGARLNKTKTKTLIKNR